MKEKLAFKLTYDKDIKGIIIPISVGSMFDNISYKLIIPREEILKAINDEDNNEENSKNDN